MTDYYVGSGGNNGNSGLSWAQRRLTLTSIETLVAAGDRVFVAPGVYRETLTCGVSGGSNYTTGTVSVTNGSAVVTGSGTAWLANAFVDGQFHVTSLALGSDGVANGTTTFTSAAGNFQAGHVGLVIQIGTKGAFTIVAVGGATSITLSGSPSAGAALSYSIMPPGPIEILSVDSNTQITLKQSWGYPSFTGLAYITYKDIKYIADVTGVNTDGVGGVVRITGSDNDQTTIRSNVIDVSTRSYRSFRGFALDFSSSPLISGSAGSDVILEDCVFRDCISNAVSVTTANQLRWTVRRCEFYSISALVITFSHTLTLSDAAHIVENCLFVSRNTAVNVTRVGGVLVRNLTIISGPLGGCVLVTTALAVGQAIVVNNCIISGCSAGFVATVNTEFIEDYNTISNSGTPRTNVNIGSHSQSYPPLFQPQLLLKGSLFILVAFALSSYSQLASIAGLNPPIEDLYGTIRANPSSWGCVQYEATRRPTDAGGSRKVA